MTIQEINDTIKTNVPELNIQIKGTSTIWIETTKGRYTLSFNPKTEKLNLYSVRRSESTFHKTIAQVLAALPS